MFFNDPTLYSVTWPVKETAFQAQIPPWQLFPWQGSFMQNLPLQSFPFQHIPQQSFPLQPLPFQNLPLQSFPFPAVPQQSFPLQPFPFQNVPQQAMPYQPLPVQAMIPRTTPPTFPPFFGFSPTAQSYPYHPIQNYPFPFPASVNPYFGMGINPFTQPLPFHGFRAF